METIIVPTDFSASAENAMFYAAELAERMGAEIFLLHIYQLPVSMSDAPLLVVQPEELKENSDHALHRAKEKLLSGFKSLTIRTESFLGDVIEELKQVCEDEDPVTIVVGKHGASDMKRALFGSTTVSIIRHIDHPVIAVPHTAKFSLERIALAVDSDSARIPVGTIKDFIEAAKAQIEIFHVEQRKTMSPDLNNLAAQLNAECTTVPDEEFFHGIESYISKKKIDLLMILPHKHNLMERLFLKTHTPELVRKLSIPLMTIHEE